MELSVQSYLHLVMRIHETGPALRGASEFHDRVPLVEPRDELIWALYKAAHAPSSFLWTSEVVSFVWFLSLAPSAITSVSCTATAHPLCTKVFGPGVKWCTETAHRNFWGCQMFSKATMRESVPVVGISWLPCLSQWAGLRVALGLGGGWGASMLSARMWSSSEGKIPHVFSLCKCFKRA